jgi:hypothetical protein
LDLAVSLLATIVDCQDARSQADFWATVLSFQVTERNTDEYKVSGPIAGGHRSTS